MIYLRRTLGKLNDFKGGKVIVAEDLNFSMNPQLGVSSRVGKSKVEHLKAIKNHCTKTNIPERRITPFTPPHMGLALII